MAAISLSKPIPLKEAWDIVDDLAYYCHYTGQIYTATEAEILGYDTY